jgi:8-oxo-dGTP diphosphatase
VILVSLAAFIHDGKLFMQKRKEEGHLDGKLELPGGKIEAGESPQVAISREVQEELGVKISADNFQLFKIYPF